ncbi:rhodanese-like domain-containing protein [Albibacterium bauzanense]|uniref:Rhodanese-related sulfurtransferase n=1 Tax=Albibacterium bauzanense TaxID=653929 RepID=A0A4V6NF50_9SPHI|nr:rhodanese-like domain-containing protein [Albibacterium bauzanense]TCK84791.1 rhodanese-related sulfurtransferase [Albibacterium bauzanense]
MPSFILIFLTIFPFFQTKERVINPEFKSELEKIYNQQIPTIDINQFLKLNSDSLFILDAREENEFNISHLRHARNVGYIWFDMRSIYDIPKDRTVIVYCSVGNRAQRIAGMLIKAGYKHVYNLYGGIFEWVNEGHPVYTNQGAQTPQIHAYNNRWSVWLERGSKVL